MFKRIDKLINDYIDNKRVSKPAFYGGRLTLLTLFLMALVLSACTKFPLPKDDDESHASFAREVIPVLLGRKPFGVDEVEVVADIADLYGRSTAVQMLMRDPLYIEHWSDVMMDLLQIQREPTGGVSATQNSSCWGTPTRATPDTSIAIWVRDHAPGDIGAPTPAWNMSDLLRSSIALDDLSPLYRANLFPMSMRRGGGNGKTVQIASHFSGTYLNRNLGCLKCHNPTFSTTNKVDGGGNIVWRRTWTIPGHPEKALFGNYYDTAAANNALNLIMRGDIRNPGEVMGIRPWGMNDACATDRTSSTASGGAISHSGFRLAGAANNPTARFGSLVGSSNPKVSLWELEESLHQGVLNLQDGYQRFTATSPLLQPGSNEEIYCNVVQAVSGNCTACHSGGSAAAGLDLTASNLGTVLVGVNTQSGSSTNTFRVVANNTAQSELFRRINSNAGIKMPPGGGGMALVGDIQTWINGGAVSFNSDICNTSTVPDVEPDEAFAFLTASNLVDGIWMSAMGARLTIDNSYSRNKQQRDALRNLTEYTFLPNDWSLKSVLKKVLSSRWMGRRAPDISQLDSAYEMPMMLDPWVEADPSIGSNRQAHEKANGQGELVNRFRVNTVLRNIATALAWKEPRAFPGGGYPSPLDQELGQYLSPGIPGFNGINFQSLLALENEAGLCVKTGHAVASDDWIDLLVQQVNNFNTNNPDAPLSVGDVWETLKDRLIQDTTIEHQLPSSLVNMANAKTEVQALVALINQGLASPITLNSSATSLSSNVLNSKLREACSVLIKSPEFLLSNITPRGYTDNNMPDPPRLTACMPNETCGYQNACEKWRSTLNQMGKHTACEDRSVRKSVAFLFPGGRVLDPVWRERELKICPPSICGFIPMPRVNECLLNPETCREMKPIPPVDPKLVEFIGKVPDDFSQAGVLMMDANGASISEVSQGVGYRPLGDKGWQALKQGTRLKTGDQLFLPLTSALHIKHRKLRFGVEPIKKKVKGGFRGQMIVIAGENSINIVDEFYRKKGALSIAEMFKAEKSGQYESRAPTKKDWQKIIAYSPRPENMYIPSLEEINKLNEDFKTLHPNFNFEEPKEPTKPKEPTGSKNEIEECIKCKENESCRVCEKIKTQLIDVRGVNEIRNVLEEIDKIKECRVCREAGECKVCEKLKQKGKLFGTEHTLPFQPTLQPVSPIVIEPWIIR